MNVVIHDGVRRVLNLCAVLLHAHREIDVLPAMCRKRLVEATDLFENPTPVEDVARVEETHSLVLYGAGKRTRKPFCLLRIGRRATYNEPATVFDRAESLLKPSSSGNAIVVGKG